MATGEWDRKRHSGYIHYREAGLNFEGKQKVIRLKGKTMTADCQVEVGIL